MDPANASHQACLSEIEEACRRKDWLTVRRLAETHGVWVAAGSLSPGSVRAALEVLKQTRRAACIDRAHALQDLRNLSRHTPYRSPAAANRHTWEIRA
jgi:hypothetical protein